MASADSASNVLRGTSLSQATPRSASRAGESEAPVSGAGDVGPICICVRSIVAAESTPFCVM